MIRWPYPRLRTLLPAMFLTSLVVAAGGALALDYRSNMQALDRRTEDGIRREALILASELAWALRNDQRSHVQALIADLVMDPALRLAMLADPDGDVVATSDRATGSSVGDAERMAAALVQVRLGKGGVLVGIDRTGRYGYAIVPVPFPAEPGSVLRGGEGLLAVIKDVGSARAGVRQATLENAARLAAGLLLLTLLQVLFVHRSVQKRLDRLKAAATRIGAGSTPVDPALGGRDEFAELSEAMRDMSHRIHSSAEALVASEARHRGLVERAPVGILVHVDGTVRLINATAAHMLGATHPSDVVGQPFERFFKPGEWAIVSERIQRIIDTDTPSVPRTTTMVRLDGEQIIAEGLGMTTDFDGERAVMAVLRDVTAQKRAELELERRDRVLGAVGRAAELVMVGEDMDESLAAALEALAQGTDAAHLILVRPRPSGDRRADQPIGEVHTRLRASFVTWSRSSAESLDLPAIKRCVAGWAESSEPFGAKGTDLVDPGLVSLSGHSAVRIPVPAADGERAWLLLMDDDSEREWSAPEIEALVVAARMFGAALSRERTLRKLRRSEKRLLEVNRITGLGHWRVDLDSGQVFYGPDTTEALGLPPEALAPSVQKALESVDPQELDIIAAAVEDFKRGRAIDLVVRLKELDGVTHWVHVVGSSGPGREGRRNALGTIRNVTERVLREDRLRTLDEQLWAVASHVPGLVYRLESDDDGNIECPFVAGGLLRELDHGADGMTLETFASLVHPEDVDTLKALFLRAAHAGEDSDVEFRLMIKGQPRWVRARASGRRLPDGRVVSHGVLIDVSDRRQLGEQLRQSQKLEAVGQLTGGIAHDFNNLLTVILANIDGIQAAVDRGVLPQRDELADLKAAAESGADLVKGLLGFSRRTDLDLQPMDLAEGITGMASLIRRVLPKSIRMEYDLGPNCGTIHADRGALQQVLFNLATNARDAMPDGGTLTIRLRSTHVGMALKTAHDWIEPGPFGVIEVQDTGIGMDADTVKRIFEPFFTTKQIGAGTGLGMGMVDGLVRQHGGFVTVDSTPGVGTTMRVYLPLLAGAARAASAESPESVSGKPLRPSSHAGMTILVVDDDDTLRRASARLLKRVGYQVRIADGGDAALAMLRAEPDAIDVVVSDLDMPGVGGLDLYKRMDAEGLRRPFVLTTGYTLEEVQLRSTLPAEIPLATKPWTVETLRTAIDDAFGRQSPPGAGAPTH